MQNPQNEKTLQDRWGEKSKDSVGAKGPGGKREQVSKGWKKLNRVSHRQVDGRATQRKALQELSVFYVRDG